MADAICIHGFAGGLAAVVQQHGPAQHRFCRHLPDRADAVLPHIVPMVRVLLGAAEHRPQFGQRRGKNIGKAHQRALREPSAQRVGQLRAHALGGNAFQSPCLAAHGGCGPRLHCKADRAQDTIFQVVPPAERVAQPALRVPCHCSYREIAPRQISAHLRHEQHGVWMPPVRITGIRAEGRDFQRTFFRQQGQRAMLQAGFQHARARKHRPHLLRPRGGTQIPIMRRSTSQAVAHTAADRPGFKPRRLQAHDRGGNMLRQAHQCPPFFCRSL